LTKAECQRWRNKKGSSLDASAPRLLACQYALPGRLQYSALQLLRIVKGKMAKAGRERVGILLLENNRVRDVLVAKAPARSAACRGQCAAQPGGLCEPHFAQTLRTNQNWHENVCFVGDCSSGDVHASHRTITVQAQLTQTFCAGGGCCDSAA
jgi:hypothetical protein